MENNFNTPLTPDENKRYTKYRDLFTKHLEKIGCNYTINDTIPDYKTTLTPDIVLPDNNIALYVNIMTSAKRYLKGVALDNIERLKKEQDTRAIQIYEPYVLDARRLPILYNIIEHAAGKSQVRYYARDTKITQYPAKTITHFFKENNIQGYRNSSTAFCLEHKKTGELLMSYTVGHAYFGKGMYDAEIARGACKLGCSVVGGASKLWKHIIDYYETHNLQGELGGSVNSIVYYVDLNHYDGRSINFLNNCEFIGNTSSFWNYWYETKELKNREPSRHKYIMEQIRNGKILPVYNAGTQTNVWWRHNPNSIEELD